EPARLTHPPSCSGYCYGTSDPLVRTGSAKTGFVLQRRERTPVVPASTSRPPPPPLASAIPCARHPPISPHPPAHPSPSQLVLLLLVYLQPLQAASRSSSSTSTGWCAIPCRPGLVWSCVCLLSPCSYS